MSADNHPKKPVPDLGDESDWEKALNAWEGGDAPAEAASAPDEGDALLESLLDEGEPAPGAAEPGPPPPAPPVAPTHGIAHSDALDVAPASADAPFAPFTDLGLAAAPESDRVAPPPASHKLHEPSVRQHPTDDETKVFRAEHPTLPAEAETVAAARAEALAAGADADSGIELDAADAVEVDTLVADDAGGPSEHEAPAPATPRVSVPPKSLSLPPKPLPGDPAPTWHDERDAASHLAERGERDAWLARAGWIEAEARAAQDRALKARGLLIAAEIAAMVGDDERSHALAAEAKQEAPNHPLAHRAARSHALRDGAWDAVVPALDAEARVAPTPAARAHAALFAAEIARVAQHDRATYGKRLEQALRASPADVRVPLAKLVDAIAEGQPLPKLRWPETPDAAALPYTVQLLARWRGASDKGDGPAPTPVDGLVRARAAFGARDRAGALAALDALSPVRGVVEGAAWLAAAVAAPEAGTRARSAELLEKLSHGRHAAAARRALAARAIESGDARAASAATSDAGEGTFDAADRLALAALSGGDGDTIRALVGDAEGNAELWPVAVGIASAVAPPGAGAPRGEWVAGTLASQAHVRLARLLAARAPADELATALRTLAAADEGSPLGRVLATELDLAAGRLDAIAAAISGMSRSTNAGAEVDRDRALAAGLVFELAGDRSRAHAEYERARKADLASEASVRAAIATGEPVDGPSLLLEHEAALDDAVRSSFALLEAALRQGDQGDPAAYASLLERAHEKAPSIPLAAFLAERAARGRGDFEGLLEWIRKRREASDDPVEAAHDLVREALLVADRELSGAAALLETASRARPSDVALRELYERIAPEPPSDRASWRAERAEEATGSERGRLALEAALELERAGDLEGATRLAQMAASDGGGGLAALAAERTEAAGPSAANVAERLMNEARTAEDPIARREAYERLADLDEHGRGDLASAALWHRSILEESPGFLPSLRKLEHQLVGEGREEELEAIAAEIAKVLPGSEATAHAAVGARLRLRSAPWDSTRDLVDAAFRVEPASLWALRQMLGLARQANDAPNVVAAAERLAARTTRPMELATLLVRAAEAALATGDEAKAHALAARALELEPAHPTALRLLAPLCEKLGELARAAETWERIAETSGAPEHRLEARYAAAVLWLDRVGEAARGRDALEAAAEIDVAHADVFPRLQGIYVAAGDRAALASLLERRLEKVTDPAERVALEITRGRALADMGDSDAAKRALAAALDANPDHVEALSAFADVCAKEADWDGAEQALIRLARLVADPGEQARIYMRLGELYDERQPNPERAELSYREVLRRIPDDVSARERLVGIYRRIGDGPKALEMQQALLGAATTPAEKRQRTIELATVYEQVLHDVRKAETTLETLRKEFPTDVGVLSALAELFQRNGQERAVQVLLDRATGDARRALSTGRFDPNLFAVLAAVSRLRGRGDAARVAEATIAALEGQPVELVGAGIGAADPKLDDLLAPDLLSPAFRSLLRKSGELLDAAVPLDLRAMRAAPLPPKEAALLSEIRQLAAGCGINVEAFVSPALGHVCVPASSFPPQIVLGAPLVASTDDAVRRFLVLRALKVVAARAAGFSRTAPIDLWPLAAAYLKTFAPDWQPQGVDAGKLGEMHARIARAVPRRMDDDVGVLALEVIGTLGNKASTLGTVVNGWGDRVALLATGDPMSGLVAIAWAGGHPNGPPPSGQERVTWIGRNAEARDLIVFSVSDAYADARSRLGVR